MITADERVFFEENGYLHVPNVLSSEHLEVVRTTFDTVWEAEASPVSRDKMLKHQVFIDLIEHPPILDRHRAMFGRQTQLLQCDLLRQGPRSNFPVRKWHRDFVFRGDTPLAINTILYLDEMTEERGPTYLIPKSHFGNELPSSEVFCDRLPGETAVHAQPGDAVFINGAIWHTGNRNDSDGPRRGIYLYYGYWWLKRYNEHQELPWQSLQGASQEKLELLGIKMPGEDLHMYGQPILNS